VCVDFNWFYIDFFCSCWKIEINSLKISQFARSCHNALCATTWAFVLITIRAQIVSFRNFINLIFVKKKNFNLSIIQFSVINCVVRLVPIGCVCFFCFSFRCYLALGDRVTQGSSKDRLDDDLADDSSVAGVGRRVAAF